MFERFTDRARKVVVLAQEVAREIPQPFITSEHILLGLMLEHDGIAARALRELGVEQADVHRKILESLGPEEKVPLSGHLPFTPESKKVLELSLREALQLGHNYIGTEHILLGVIRGCDRVEQYLPVTLAEVRNQIISILKGEQAPEPEIEVKVVDQAGHGLDSLNSDEIDLAVIKLLVGYHEAGTVSTKDAMDTIKKLL